MCSLVLDSSAGSSCGPLGLALGSGELYGDARRLLGQERESHKQHCQWLRQAAGLPPPRRRQEAPTTRSASAAAAAPQRTHIHAIPPELFHTIFKSVLVDDTANERRPVLQYVCRGWRAAYQASFYSAVSCDISAALRQLQREGGLCQRGAEEELLRWVAARLPHAMALQLSAVPAAPAACSDGSLPCRLGQLLLAPGGGAAPPGAAALRHLRTCWLPALPQLLPQLRRLTSLWLVAPAAEVVSHAALLAQQPLHSLQITDAAGASPHLAQALAGAMSHFTRLRYVTLGGGGAPAAAAAAAAAAALGAWGATPEAAAAAAAAEAAESPPSLLHLPLVAAVAGLPALERLQLSLAFSRAASEEQQGYLLLLGHVLRIQQRHRQLVQQAQRAQHAQQLPLLQRARRAAAAAAGGNICLTVHEHCQGDLSAVPVASCTLNLDWDDESNPIEVWQCSALRRLRIAAQLPLAPGQQFRPGRLRSLEDLVLCGCCYIPGYFAEALQQMHQLESIAFIACGGMALESMPWDQVLPHLQLLRTFSIQQHGGADLGPLWQALSSCPNLTALQLTGNFAGGLTSTSTLYAPIAPAVVAPAAATGAAGDRSVPPPNPFALTPPAAPEQRQEGEGESPPAGFRVPPAVGTLRALRRLDLRGNALSALSAELSSCCHLSTLELGDNCLAAVPPALCTLGTLRHLGLERNQLSALACGPYLAQLDRLLLAGNPLPRRALLPLLRAARLREISLPPSYDVPALAVLMARLPWLRVLPC